jgi:hypothetical protein
LLAQIMQEEHGDSGLFQCAGEYPMAEQVAALQTDLENIDRAANILPLRHSDLFLSCSCIPT